MNFINLDQNLKTNEAETEFNMTHLKSSVHPSENNNPNISPAAKNLHESQRVSKTFDGLVLQDGNNQTPGVSKDNQSEKLVKDGHNSRNQGQMTHTENFSSNFQLQQQESESGASKESTVPKKKPVNVQILQQFLTVQTQFRTVQSPGFSKTDTSWDSSYRNYGKRLRQLEEEKKLREVRNSKGLLLREQLGVQECTSEIKQTEVISEKDTIQTNIKVESPKE